MILLAARFMSVWSARLVRALRLRALALQRSMMVAAASIVGCCWTKLGEGWSRELGSEEEEWKSVDATVNDLRCTRAFWECSWGLVASIILLLVEEEVSIKTWVHAGSYSRSSTVGGESRITSFSFRGEVLVISPPSPPDDDGNGSYTMKFGSTVKLLFTSKRNRTAYDCVGGKRGQRMTPSSSASSSSSTPLASGVHLN